MEKTWNLEYDCPQFLDFKDLPQDENLEEYFGVDHERSKKSIFDVNSSVSTCATASPSVDASHFPVHNGPFIFNAKPKDVQKSMTNTKSRRKSAPSKNIYSFRLTPSRVERLRQDEMSPLTKKTRNSTGSPSMPVVSNSIEKPSAVKTLKSLNLNVVPKLTMKTKCFNKSNFKSILRSTSRFTVTESSDPYTKVDFKAMLRSNTKEGNIQAKTQGKMTVTKPFNFSQTRKRKLEEPVEPYIPMAERVLKFQKERGTTPDMKPPIHSSVSSNSSYRVTKPISPKLRTLTRHREVTAISQREKETMEAEEMKKFQFKAHPVNTKIFKMTAKVNPQKRKLSVPDFQLPSEKLLVKPEKPVIEERKYKFRARPAPKNILNHVVGVSEKSKVEPTKPKTPPFALKERESQWTIREMKTDKRREPNKMHSLKSRNTTNHHNSISIVQQPFDKKPTAPVPFSFHDKDLERFAKRDERIKMELEEASKVPKFQANPLPSPSVFGVPEKRAASATEPVPFDLMIDHRGKVLAQKWQRQVEDEIKKQKEALIFKAQPNEVVYKSGFKPKKPEKPLTEMLNICLNTEVRAQERGEFDEKIKQRQNELEHLRILKEMERAEEEKIQMVETRAQLVHKANPVRQFKPVHVKKGLIDLTIPQTPEFETDKRLKRFKRN